MKKLFYIFMGLGLLFGAICFFIFFPVANFPSPKGFYGIGEKNYHWVDLSRKELNSQDVKHPYREIMVYVFYPTVKSEVKNLVSFDFDAAQSSIEYLAKTSKFPRWVFNNIKFIKVHSKYDAFIAQNKIVFPIIIFSPGGGLMVQHYSHLIEGLVSQGFVVIGINHPYIADIVRYADGHIVKSAMQDKKQEAKKTGQSFSKWKSEQVEENAKDISFVINKIQEIASKKDNFWGNIDFNKIGLLGHSFGGRTITHTILNDKRIKCGCNLDGGIEESDAKKPFLKPFLFVMGGKSHIWNKDNSYSKAVDPLGLKMIEELANVKNGNVSILTIDGVGHGLFTDTPLQLNRILFTRFLSRFVDFYLGQSSNKAFDILVNNVMPEINIFFDKNLKNK